MMKNSTLLLLFLIIGNGTRAQSINPPDDKLYMMDEITVIELTMNQDDVTSLLDNIDPWSNEYYHAGIRIHNSKIDSSRRDVGVRLRGNTSRYKIKKSIKIDFKEWGGEKLDNYKKLNLKAETNDVSLSREMLALYLYRSYNIPAARTSYVKLYINNEYKGIYLNVEQIDDEFVDRRYGNEEGNLYKCHYGAELYDENTIFDNGIYELKNNEEINDRALLSNLVKVLNSNNGESLKTKLELIFDVENYIKQMAIETLLGHWDGYSYNMNNYYLYENPNTSKIHFIPYDADNTFGIDYIGPDWAYEDIETWYTDYHEVPLTKKILAINDYFLNYCRHIFFAMEDLFNENHLFPILDNTMNMIKSAVSTDPLFSADNGFSYNDFLNSYRTAYGAWLEYGVKQYISARISSASSQLANLNVGINAIGQPQNNLIVFPNPIKNGLFYVKGVKEDKLTTAFMYDFTGRSLPFSFIKQGTGEYLISFDNHPQPGIYVLTIGQQTKKIVVK